MQEGTEEIEFADKEAAPVIKDKTDIKYYDCAVVYTPRATEKDKAFIQDIFKKFTFDIYQIKERDQIFCTCLHQLSWEKLAVEAEAGKIQIYADVPGKTEEKEKKKEELKQSLYERGLKKVYFYQVETISFRMKIIEQLGAMEKNKNKSKEEIFHECITLADRQRFITNIIKNIKLSEVFNDVTTWRTLAKTNQTYRDDDYFIYFLQNEGLVTEIVQLHTHKQRAKIFQDLARSWNPPVPQIRNYLGEEAGMYFEWMKFYTNWLVIPGIISLLIFVLDPRNPEQNPLFGFYSAGIVIWAILFNIFWKRRENELKVEWGNHRTTYNKEILRIDYYGAERVNPVTQEREIHYRKWKRFLRYIFSFFISFLWFIPTLYMMICFLNLNGYIKKGDLLEFLRNETLSRQVEEGGWCDINSNFWGYIPGIAQALVTMVFNKVYQRIAHWCTKQENHRTDAEYNNAVILKRFIFEFCDCFIPLFYVAFIRRNIAEFRILMLSYYMCDEIRRIFQESIQPMLMSSLSFSFIKNIVNKKVDKKHLLSFQDEDIIKNQLTAWEFEPFDDYLEMVIQFGYLTLFAGAYPFITFLSLVFNFLELKSDGFKLLLIYRRKEAAKTSTIGIWEPILTLFSFLAIFTNIFLFGFAGTGFEAVFPKVVDVVQDQVVAESGKAWQQALILFGIEHFFVVFLILAAYFINTRPKWIRVFYSRISHCKLQKLHRKKEKNIKKIKDQKEGEADFKDAMFGKVDFGDSEAQKIMGTIQRSSWSIKKFE